MDNVLEHIRMREPQEAHDAIAELLQDVASTLAVSLAAGATAPSPAKRPEKPAIRARKRSV